jgi:transposase
LSGPKPKAPGFAGGYLLSGASAHLRQQIARGVNDPWLRDLLARRPYKVAMVAFAAKTARIVWAMLAKGEVYRDRASASAAA